MKWELKYWLFVDNEELEMTKEVDEFSIVPLKTKAETIDDTITKRIEYRNNNGEKGVFSMRYVISIKPITQPTTARERVVVELAELENRRSRAYLFVYSDKFLELSEIEQCLLRNQLGVMQKYASILRDRLRLWEE